MKVALFDDILERHVRRSLARALRARGHEVIETEPVWRGHRLPSSPEDCQRVEAALEATVSAKPDLLLNFRASTLPPRLIGRLRVAGIRTAVWLPDDPVLYNVCYRHIVDHYDLVLNCGGTPVLDFYREGHGLRGVNFPFWTDVSEFAPPPVPCEVEADFVFLGNCVGPVRSSRYSIISSLPGRVRIHGKVNPDPLLLSGGWLDSNELVSKALHSARIGFNIPQFFSDYQKPSPYYFPLLPTLGSFQFPSRVIQYMACSLPVLTYGRVTPPETFPEMLVASSAEELALVAREALADQEALASRAEKTRARFDASFSADRRAEFLEFLLENQEAAEKADSRTRANLFADFGRKPANSTLPLRSGRRWKVLHLSASDRVDGDSKVIADLGHDVRSVDLRTDRKLLQEVDGAEPCKGPYILDSARVLSEADRLGAHLVIFGPGPIRIWKEGADLLKLHGLILLGMVPHSEEEGGVSKEGPAPSCDLVSTDPTSLGWAGLLDQVEGLLLPSLGCLRKLVVGRRSGSA